MFSGRLLPSRVPTMVRHATAWDTQAIQYVLRDLPALYPQADLWLSRRLREAWDGRAICYVAEVGGVIGGVAIRTPKAAKREKLSTLFVASDYRGMGVGAQLLDACAYDWWRRGVDDVTVTVRCGIHLPLFGLLMPRGFRVTALEMRRYRGADEFVLTSHPTWSPATRGFAVATTNS